MGTVIQTNTKIDKLTGEILEDTVSVQNNKNGKSDKELEGKYIKLYLTDISKIFDLAPFEYNVLFCLFDIAEYGTGILDLSQRVKKHKIIEPLGIKPQTLKNALSKLKAKRLIWALEERGAYRLNPNLFFKGETIDNVKLKLSITYDENGREIEVKQIKK